MMYFESHMMRKTLAIFMLLILTTGMINASYAHKSQIIGNYKFEIGWENEPPIVGKENAIIIMITHASEDEKVLSEENRSDHPAHDEMSEEEHDEMSEEEHDEMSEEEHDEMSEEEHDEMSEEEHDEMSEEGVEGLASMLEASVTLNDEMFALELTESEDTPGLYIAKFTPTSTGYPIYHLTGILDDEAFEMDFHPEEIIAKQMPPLQQQKEGIEPSGIQCSEGKILLSKVSDGSAICVKPGTADILVARNWAAYF
jgi:hypothetical protein